MRVLFINDVCGHTSTGRICAQQAEKFHKDGHEVKIAYGRDGFVLEQYQKYAVRIGSDFDVKCHGVMTRLLDAHGLGSKASTRRFLKWAEEYDPDLLWLHNIHGYYINYELLFDWINFTYAKCDKWKRQCENCPQKKTYPASFLFDRSNKNYSLKKSSFVGISNMTIITPSKWLAGLVKQSFLAGYPVEVHYNTIDTKVFKPTESRFRELHGIEDKKMILAVSNAWQEPRKGLNDIYRLRKLLDDRYAFVIVGLTEDLMRSIPKGVIGIAKTSNASELAGIYTTADVLINPTCEDNFRRSTWKRRHAALR